MVNNKATLKCPDCSSTKLVKAGKLWAGGRKRLQRYRCNNCGRTTIYPKGGKG